MKLASGRDHLAIPGPSVIPDRVLRAMHRAAPNIYAGELVDMTATVLSDLKTIAGCSGDVAIYHGNGHAAWEAGLCNMASRGDRVLVLVTGRFGHAWAKMVEGLGIKAETIEFGSDQSVDTSRVAKALQADTKQEIKAVLTVQTDTASSSTNDISAIRDALHQVAHPALLVVDAIASFGCEPFHMDEWGVDMLITASQKGLMTTPGLGLLFVSERVWPAHASAGLNTPYWDMKPRIYPKMFPDHFCGTPPTHLLYGLRESLDMLLEESMVGVWQRHQALSECVWSTVDAWAVEGHLQCNIPDKAHRSRAVTAIRTARGDAIRLREWCEKETGVVLGIGLGASASDPARDDLFRIGHMGHLNPAMLLGTLGCIDAGLKSLEIPHGPAALAAASQSICDSVETP